MRLGLQLTDVFVGGELCDYIFAKTYNSNVKVWDLLSSFGHCFILFLRTTIKTLDDTLGLMPKSSI